MIHQNAMRTCLSGFASICLAIISLGQAPPQPAPLPPIPPRPGGNTEPTKVSYALWIGDITRIDSVEQTFSAGMVLILRWHDPQLAHAGPAAKRYNLDDIWHPQLLNANQAESVDFSLPE